MDIVKRLKIGGNEEVTAALIKDGDLEYPVFLESLLNSVICDELLNSGWQLCGLPYDFRKDGIKFSDLPVEDFNPTTSEQQDMWDSIGEKLSQDELKSRMTAAAIEYLPMPDAEYTITTREDFLKYLEDVESISLDSDFLPINYFVHPTALFTFEEYTSGKYARYIEIMGRRRRMSYTKFNMLVAWGFKHGLNKNFEAIDFLDFYYQWGIDGLNMPLISKKRETRYRILDGGDISLEKIHQQFIYRHEFGLVDRTGTILVPEETKSLKWEPKTDNQQAYEESYIHLKENDTRLVDLVCKSSEESTIMEGLQANVQYDINVVLVGSLRLPNIYVYSNDSSNKPISPDYWNPNAYGKLTEVCYLRALAQAAIRKCITPCNASSFKALTMSGCSPYSALVYYVLNEKLDKGKIDDITGKVTAGEDSMPVITLFDVDKYIEGRPLEEDKYDVLDNFVRGIANIDHTYEGIQAEAEYSADSMYEELYAIHYVLGVGLDELYEKITNIGDEEEIVFSGHGYNHTLKLPKLKLKMNGYHCDLEDYRDAAINDAVEYVYVTKIAREIGTVEAKRHVAFECLTMERNSHTKEMLTTLRDMFISRIESNVIGIQQQASYKKLAPMFAAARFFEAAIKGTVTFPKAVGGEVVMLTPAEQMSYRNSLTTNIESTTVYCDTNVEQNGNFRRYCINAYITPEYIIPKSAYTIPESSFIALWRDFSSVPEVRAKLVAKGLIPQNHVAWENRYFNEKLCLTDILSDRTLVYYNDNANKFRESVAETDEFVAVPHPLEYLTPGMFKEDEDDMTATSSVPLRTGLPNFAVGDAYTRSLSDYDEIVNVEGTDENSNVGFSLFRGYDADDFYMVKDVLKTVLPVTDKNITIYPPMKFYTKETGVADYSDIVKLDTTQYPVKNIRGRKYVLRDIKGKYWEVMI